MNRAEPTRAGGPVWFEVDCISDTRSLAVLRKEVRERLVGYSVGSAACNAVDLVLEELVGNTIRYGFEDNEPHRIAVRVEVGSSALAVTLTDDGRSFDPTRHPEPKGHRSLSEATVGGVGIAMVRRVVRRWVYSRQGEINRLELEVAR